MGVLSCNRLGCPNIMSDFYSETHGYLCYSCKRELKSVSGSMTIRQFMNTSVSYNERSLEWENYVEAEFKSRYE